MAAAIITKTDTMRAFRRHRVIQKHLVLGSEIGRNSLF